MKKNSPTLYLIPIILCLLTTQALAQANTTDGLSPQLDNIKDLFSFTKILSSIVVLGGTYLLTKVLAFLLAVIAEKKSSYRLLLKRITPFLNIALWSASLFVVIAGIISPPIETVFTVGASIGVAVGFASQDILKNIFGGIVIILDRPFQVGDKIGIDDFYGEVKEIGLRSTRIITPDDSVVSIPNADVMSNSVSNSNSGALDCQVVTSIYLPASTDLKIVKEVSYRAAYSSRYLYLKKPVSVIVENKVFEQNFVVHVKIKAYVLDIRYEFLLKAEITELVLTELRSLDLISDREIVQQPAS